MNVGTGVGIWGGEGVAAHIAERDAVLKGRDPVITS